MEGPRDNFTTYNYGTYPQSQADYTYKVESLDMQYNRQIGNEFRSTGTTFILA